MQERTGKAEEFVAGLNVVVAGNATAQGHETKTFGSDSQDVARAEDVAVRQRDPGRQRIVCEEFCVSRKVKNLTGPQRFEDASARYVLARASAGSQDF